MKENKKLKLLQTIYAASLAETVNTYQKLNILDQAVAAKKPRHLQTASSMIEQFQIKSVKDVFLNLYDVFQCSNWKVTETEDEYIAKAESCKLCALSKMMGGANPCDGWCLDPIKAMITALTDNKITINNINVCSTLLNDDCCLVKVSKVNM